MKGKYFCHICERAYKDKGCYSRHLLQHRDKNVVVTLYRCVLCDVEKGRINKKLCLKWDSEEKVRKHLRNSHLIQDGDPKQDVSFRKVSKIILLLINNIIELSFCSEL